MGERDSSPFRASSSLQLPLRALQAYGFLDGLAGIAVEGLGAVMLFGTIKVPDSELLPWGRLPACHGRQDVCTTAGDTRRLVPTWQRGHAAVCSYMVAGTRCGVSLRRLAKYLDPHGVLA